MKIFLLICLVAVVASADKLDRTYLPPPGSKFSGGSPGDIQVPLEFPKETYLTVQTRPQDGIPELELGINRRPKPVGSTQSSTQKPFSYFQNHVPTTTTSYAITQTTTFAPPGDYHGLESSSFSNATETSKQPQGAGQIYQQPNRGQFDNTPSYNQYQQGNQQSFIPYGSSTQRPLFQSNRKSIPYLPPTPSSYKEQSSSEVPSIQNSLGYLSGQPQGPSYQDGHQSSMFGQGINQPDFTSPQVNQPNQFVGNVNIPSSTAVTQYQDESFGPTTEPDVNQQGFESSVPTQQNLYQLPGLPGFPTSTAESESQDKIRLTTPGLVEENQYLQSQNFPASTLASQYLNEQRIISPGSNLKNQYISSTTSPVYQDTKKNVKSGPEPHRFQQNQNYYPGNQNFSTSTAATQYQNRQQFTPPGSMKQSQYLGNQNTLSTATPQYQDGQRFAKPGAPQETIASNQQVFGSRIPNQKNINRYPGNRNFFSTTAAPEFQNGQQFTTSGSKQSNQYFENQNAPSTPFPQYEDSQHILTPEVSRKAQNHQVFGSRVPTQQNQNQGFQHFRSSTAIPQFTDSIGFTTLGPIQLSSSGPAQNKHLYQGLQNYPSSTTGSVPSQYITDQEVPTTRPHFQNGQRFNIPGAQEQFLNQQNQQHPSTVAPQYQSTFAPTTGSNQQGISSVNQYSSQPHYSQRFPPSTGSPQQFLTESQATNGNDGIQPIPGTISSSRPELSSQAIVPSSPHYNLATSSTTAGPFPTRGYPTTVSGLVYQDRPERPQAATDRTAEILSYENVLTPDGYSYSYDTSNGIHADETGIVGDGTKAQGGFSYTGDDGKVYSVFYSADENGFRPRGDHLPTPPPIPEAIQRVIEQANKDRDSGFFDDGSYNEEMYGYMKYDGNLTQPRQKNKTLSEKNGVDTENYQTRFGAQKKKEFIQKTENETYFENTEQDINKEEQAENSKLDDRNMKIQGEVNRRIPNKRPTSVKNITVEDMKAKSMNRKNFNRRPVSDNQGGEISDDILNTGVSDDDEDLDNEPDVVNYKDDPDSRTNFRGTNKYLPNPKKVNQLSQFNRQPALPDNAKQLAKETNKQRKPNVHKSQAQTTVYGDEEELIVEDNIRNPSRKNKTNKKGKDQPNFGPLDNTSNLEKSDDYTDNDYTDINSKSESDDEIQSMKTDRRYKPGNHQYENKRLNKPKNSRNNEDDTKIARDEETGYQYNPPQKNLDLEEKIKFSPRTSVTAKPKPISQKGSQKTTIHPFMTPKVYENEEVAIDEDVIESDNSGKPLRPLRPLPSQKGTYPTTGNGNSIYNDNVTPEVANEGQFDSTRQPTGTTPSRRPYGRPQSSPAPGHDKKDTNGQNELNIPIKTQNSHPPGNKVFNNSNTPNKGISNVENGKFVSTTPLPHSGSDLNNEYQQPGQYQTSIKPTDSSRFFEENAPGNEDIVRRPVTNSESRFPNTTYRSNYTFGDKTSAPSGSISANGFGRPIPSTAPQIIGETSKNEPGNVENNFRPGVGRFGVTSAPTQGSGNYRGSSTAPKGEDFSGPKHPQGFDPKTGYYYK